MIADLEIVQYDTLPHLIATLYADDGTPEDLTAATVRLIVEDSIGAVLVDEALCTIVGDPVQGMVNFAFCQILTAAPGAYWFEFHLARVGVEVLTFPTTGPLQLVIRRRLGGVPGSPPMPLVTDGSWLLDGSQILDGVKR